MSYLVLLAALPARVSSLGSGRDSPPSAAFYQNKNKHEKQRAPASDDMGDYDMKILRLIYRIWQ